jgi:uncharacterized membrane protein
MLLLGLGRLLGFSRRELLLASNANIGGPPTVAGAREDGEEGEVFGALGAGP